MAVRTAWSASGIALWLFAQVPGFSGAVLPKAGTSAVLARGFRFDATRFGALPGVCADFKVVADLLETNSGGGLFAFDHMQRAPAVYTDASKESRYAGGGYVSMCGRYRWWTYGSAAARQPIDFLEGDAVLLAAIDLGPMWAGKIVPLYIDNRSF